MSHTLNLDNYFARIGYAGPRAPTLEVLQAIHRLHPRAIPFENLNPLTRRAVKLDLESVETNSSTIIAAAIASNRTRCSRMCCRSWAFA